MISWVDKQFPTRINIIAGLYLKLKSAIHCHLRNKVVPVGSTKGHKFLIKSLERKLLANDLNNSVGDLLNSTSALWTGEKKLAGAKSGSFQACGYLRPQSSGCSLFVGKNIFSKICNHG